MAKRRRVPTQYQAPNQDVDGNIMREPDAGRESQRWWVLQDETSLLNAVMHRITMLRERTRARREMCRFYCEQYGTQELLGIGLTSYDPAHRGFIAPSLPYNVVRRAVNTVHAKITKHKPLPMVLTERGDYKQTKRAMKLTNFIAGVFSPQGIDAFAHGSVAAKHAEVMGAGLCKVWHMPGDRLPRMTKLFPWEVYVDAADARAGTPKQLFLAEWRDKTEVMQQLRALKADQDLIDKVDRAESGTGIIDDNPGYADTADLVLVFEAYRLPVGEGENQIPGRKVMLIDNAILTDEEWTKPYFPVVALPYSKPILGSVLHSESLAAEVSGFQFEVNYVIETQRMGMRVAGTGIWMVPDNCDVPDTHFENGTGLLLRYRAPFKPEYVQPMPLHPQQFEYLDRMTRGALEWGPGLSTLSANGQKQPGITAAKAIQTIQDVEDDGLSPFEDAYEQFYVDLAEHVIDECRDIAEESGGNLRVMAPQKRSVMWIDWKDVDMARDRIVMQVWPTNLLGRTPAARLQMVNDLFNGGIIDRPLYLRLLDAPDIDSETDLAGAMQEVADQQIEAILDFDVPANDNGGKRVLKKLDALYEKSRPDPYQDLVYAMHRAQQHICFGKLRGVPDLILDYLRRYIEDAKAELDKAAEEDRQKQAAANQQAQAAAAQAAAGGALQGAPIGPPGGPPPGPAPMMAPPPAGGPTPPAGGPPPPPMGAAA